MARQVWETIDGRLFREGADAEAHERWLKERVSMWDENCVFTIDPAHAMVVHLVGEDAADLFFDICKANECLVPSAQEMCSGDEGWWFWSEIEDRYVALTNEEIARFKKMPW